MTDRNTHVLDLYTRHPISAQQIIAKVRASRGHLENLTPEDLYPHDQDHYGGLSANDALAERASIRRDEHVADFCAGLGGPARYWSRRFGAEVTGIDLNPARVRGAAELTALVGLESRVRIIEGDVTRTGLPSESFDVVVSQEAFLHVPDTAAALAEAFRLLRPGGRLAFTDWTVHRPLSSEEADIMWRGIAAQSLQSSDSYRNLIRTVGFAILSVDDLTDEWGVILEERFAMYRQLREETLRQGLPAGDEEFYAGLWKAGGIDESARARRWALRCRETNTLIRLLDLYSSVTAIPES
jgi:sarcosine/dimethylglycine N-methyltransferase